MPGSSEDNSVLSFGPYRLDRAAARLTCEGRTVAITPKSLEVLTFLASRPDKLVSKDLLLSEVWKDAIVSDASIKVCVREIRMALGDGIKEPKYIETVHGKGYRFIGMQQGVVGALVAEEGEDGGGMKSMVVAREEELSQLQGALGEAEGGRRQCVFVAGGAGTGKTALIEAFQEVVGGKAVFLKGHCFEQFGTAEPYMPIWEAMGRLPSRLQASLGGVLSMRATGEKDGARFSEPRVSSERLLRELVTAIEKLAAEQTVVLVIEDVHWADFSTLDLVTALARRRSPGKLLMVVTYRREGITHGHPLRTVFNGLATASLCSEISVGLLDIRGVEAFLAKRVPGRRFPAAFARRLLQRTNGHPLFLVHLTNELIDQGLLPDGGDGVRELGLGWRTALETRVPWTVRAMIEGDVERLPEDRRQILEAAAVAGIEFSAAAVAAVVGQDSARVDEVCDALARLHRFLEPRGMATWPDGTVAGKYAFVHEMYHNVVYERVPLPRRMRAHLTVGLRMEAAWGNRVAEESAALATHFERGGDWERAVKYLRRTAAGATRQHAHREALQSLRRALAAVERLPAEGRKSHELDVLMGMAVNLRVLEGCAAAEVREVHERAYALVEAEARELGRDPLRIFPVLWGIWVFHKVRSDLGLAERLAAQLLTMAQAEGSAELKLQAHQAVSVTALCMGRPEVTVGHMQAAMEIYSPQKHGESAEHFGQDPGVAVLAFAGAAYALMGDARNAEKAQQRAVELAAQLNQPSSIALATHFAGMTSQILGDAKATAMWARETIDLSAAEGYSYWLAGSTVLAGWAEVAGAAGGEGGEGIATIQAGLAAWRETGSRTYLTYFLGLLADAQLRLGRVEEAAASVEEALGLVEPLGERMYEGQLRRLREECRRPVSRGVMGEETDGLTGAGASA